MSNYIGIEQARRAREKKSKAPPIALVEDERRIIRVDLSDLEPCVNKIEAALIASDRGLYQRAGKIVGVGENKQVTNGSEVPALQIFERGEHALLEDFTSVARFEKWDGRSKDFVFTEPPLKMVKVLRERSGRLRLPPLTSIVNAPTLRPDGSVLDRPSYDTATGLLFEPCGISFPPVPARPSRAEAATALGLLKNLIGSFPFVAEADRSVALSALLTASVRRSLTTAPLHGFTTPAAGTGKSLLADVASVIATGRRASVIAQGRTEEENEKRLGSILLTGDQVLAIDNCETPLGGEFLCQVLTQPMVRTRVLGRSEVPELPTGVFVSSTGNNLVLAGDITRRAILCSLDAKMARPELRVFEGNPLDIVRADRGRYVVAVLTILRAFVVAGRPRQSDPLGSFEDWSGLVRGALLWLGCADPVATTETARASDPALNRKIAMATQWWHAIGNERVTAHEAIARATEKVRNTFDPDSPPAFKRPAFRDALLAVAGSSGMIDAGRLGTWLGRNKDTVIASPIDEEIGSELRKRRFVRMPMIDGLWTWTLEEDLDAPRF